MTSACVLLCSVVVAASPVTEGNDAISSLVFQDEFGPDSVDRWAANSAKLVVQPCREQSDGYCLQIEDAGDNSQAFVRLAVERGATYRLEIDGQRALGNRGKWLGCAAIASSGGRGSQSTYIAQSEFIGERGCWCPLSLEFTAPNRSVFVILAGQNAEGDLTRFKGLRIFKLPSAALHVLPPIDAPTSPITSVALSGAPGEIGAIWGRINADAVRHDLEEYYLKPARTRGLTPEELVRRADVFVELAERFAPHWLPETRAIAQAAGIDSDVYLAYVGTVYRGLWAGEDCTSYAISCKAARDNGIFFHKTRDNQPKHQCAFLIDTDVPGVNRFIAVSDASVLSCMMMVNEKGLAGSADMGGLKIDKPRFEGWMNTALLRHIAERANDCEQALSIVRRFVENGWYAGGGAVGTHWLFVDAKGRILEISNNSSNLTHDWHDEDKVYFSANRDRAIERLRNAEPPIDFATFHNVSRDAAMCFPSSVSGMSVHIDREHPEVLTQAWISMPACSLSFPLIMGGSATPLPLLNGRIDVTGRDAACSPAKCEPIEALAYQHLALVQDHVRNLLSMGRRHDGARLIDKWIVDTTTAHLAILEQ